MLLDEVLAGGVLGGTPILYAGLGEAISERAGVVNLGTEGCMLGGALAGFAVASETSNAWVGVLAGGVAGGLLAALHATFVLKRGSNQLATGLVILFLGLGLTSMFGVNYVQAPAPALDVVKIPLLHDIPGIGSILFEHDALVYLSFGLVPIVWWLVHRSRWGVLLRAAGERSEVLDTLGYPVMVIRLVAVTLGGVLAGFGGAHLSEAYTKQWSENMVQGRGFVAVAVVMFAARHPLKIAGGAYLFGAALALSPALQARGWSVNQFALDALPYALTLLVLILLGRRGAAAVPEELSKVFNTAPS
jgi:general nucleoside transport system permease protein